jgi:hypothetical protein
MLISGFGNKPARSARRLRELPGATTDRRHARSVHAAFAPWVP